MKKEQPGVEKGFREQVDSAGNSGHPEQDQFVEGKIGSGYMSTIEGQPHLEDSVDEIGVSTKKKKNLMDHHGKSEN